MNKVTSILYLNLILLAGCSIGQTETDYTTWEVRGGSPLSIRYSSSDEIDTANVGQLQVAWTYKTGDADTARDSQIQANAIVVDGLLYSTSPGLKVFALDAISGEEQWVFDPYSDTTENENGLNANRGVTYWEDGDDKRILFTAGPTLYALDAGDGTLVEEFGNGGKTSLKKGLGERAAERYVAATSPGIVYQDLIIIGSRVSESSDAAPGDVRAFNVRSGKLEWTFHTIPRPGEPGYETWRDPEAWKQAGGANSWAGMALDEQRGIVYIPTGSASPDFYGGDRKGRNLYSNSLLALDASTGERIWHFQTVHHDLWDRDLPSPPSLVTVSHGGDQIDAVAQTSKTGFVFLFDRETGKPLFPIEEREVPGTSQLKGEEPWPTQPAPVRPKPFTRQRMTVDDINPYAPKDVREQIKKELKSLKSGHMFEPPSQRGTLMFPGFDGGAEWGGSAFDPETGILYVNSNEVPWILTMVPTDMLTDMDTDTEVGVAAVSETDADNDIGIGANISTGTSTNTLARGKAAYMINCISCHGPDRKGSGNNPSLVDVGKQYNPEEILDVVNNGRRMMPGFNHLPEARKKAIVNFLIGREHYEVEKLSDGKEITAAADDTAPYVMTGYKKFRTPEGYPAVSPPWGTLNAINLNTGEYEWRIPLGEYPELKKKGIPPTGTENYGGPVVTAGGVVFIAATPIKKIRAFNKRTGQLLWEHELPAAGFATPSVYEIDGKQYVVIACGGGKLGAVSGDTYVAFSLPE